MRAVRGRPLRSRPSRAGPPRMPWGGGGGGGGPAVDAWGRRRAQACSSTLSPDGGARRRGWAASGRTGVHGRALSPFRLDLLVAVMALIEFQLELAFLVPDGPHDGIAALAL